MVNKEYENTQAHSSKTIVMNKTNKNVMKIVITKKESLIAVENTRNKDSYNVEKSSIANCFTLIHECDDFNGEEKYELCSVLGHYNKLLDIVSFADVEEEKSEDNSRQLEYVKAVKDWMEGETKESLSALNDALWEIKDYLIGKNEDTKAMQIDNAAELVNRILLCERKESQK